MHSSFAIWNVFVHFTRTLHWDGSRYHFVIPTRNENANGSCEPSTEHGIWIMVMSCISLLYPMIPITNSAQLMSHIVYYTKYYYTVANCYLGWIEFWCQIFYYTQMWCKIEYAEFVFQWWKFHVGKYNRLKRFSFYFEK